MYEIGVVGQFEAAHRLVGDFGPATRMHGHTYRLEVIVRGAGLQADGTLYDISKLQAAMQTVIDAMHYRDLADVPGLADVNTTAEAVARYCWGEIAPTLQHASLSALRVCVWESPLAYAAYEAPISG